MSRRSVSVFVLATLVSATLSFAADLPRVVILATGGTIAGVQPKEGEPGYKSGSLSIDSLIKGAPGVDKLARLDGEQIASIGSQDMNDAVWLKLARRANVLLALPDVAGIVVTHGTDTLEETGYFLDLVLTLESRAVQGTKMCNRLVQGPFFGAALYRFVPTGFIQSGKKLSLNATHFDKIIG